MIKRSSYLEKYFDKQPEHKICSKPTRANTAEKRLRMHQIMKIWREFEYQFLKQKHALIGQKLVKQTRKYSKWVD